MANTTTRLMQGGRVTSTDPNLLLLDVSQKTTKANVVREGYQVPAPELDAVKSDFIISNLPQVDFTLAPRVVSQSIKTGTKVVPGTVVDLVLAPRTIIPFDIFANTHADFIGKTLDFADTTLNDTKTREVLLTYDTADQLPTDSKAIVAQTLAANHIVVNEADPNRTFSKAYGMLRSALAYR